jgi:hypothetical protein
MPAGEPSKNRNIKRNEVIKYGLMRSSQTMVVRARGEDNETNIQQLRDYSIGRRDGRHCNGAG